MMNNNHRVVNYTLFGLIPHSQHIVRVMADSTATDTVPAELAQKSLHNSTPQALLCEHYQMVRGQTHIIL